MINAHSKELQTIPCKTEQNGDDLMDIFLGI